MDLAMIGLGVESSQVPVAKGRLDDLAHAGRNAESATASFMGAWGRLTASFAAGQALYATVLNTVRSVINIFGEAAQMAARYETLGIVMNRVGANAGYNSNQLGALQKELEKTGIAALESRETLTRLVQAHIDLRNASQLARIAQDAAVIANTNSSDAFMRLVYGIQSGQTEILRSIGINVNFSQSYEKMAQSLNKGVKELSEMEKTQARANAVIARGSDIAGVYSDAMETAGKQMSSLKRYQDNLMVALGGGLQEGLVLAVAALTNAYMMANKEAAQQEEVIKEAGRAIAKAMAVGGDGVHFLIVGLQQAYEYMKLLGNTAIMGDWQSNWSKIKELGSGVGSAAEMQEKLELQRRLRENQAVIDRKTNELYPARNSDPRLITRTDDEAAANKIREKQKEAEESAKSLRKEIESTIESLERQIAVFGKESEFQKMLWEIEKGRYKDWDQNSKIKLISMAGELDVLKQEEEAQKKYTKALTEGYEAEMKRLGVIDRINTANRQALSDGVFQLQTIGKTSYEIEMMTAMRSHDLETEKQRQELITNGATQTEIEAFEQDRDALRKLTEQRTEDAEEERKRQESVAAGRKAWLKEYEDGIKDAKRQNEDLSRSLTDALMRGFESGKNIARNFLDTLKNWFATTILQPQIKGIVSTITSGFMGNASASGGGGGGGGMFSSLNSLRNTQFGQQAMPSWFGGGNYGNSSQSADWAPGETGSGGPMSLAGGMFNTGGGLSGALGGAGVGAFIGSIGAMMVSERRQTGAQMGGMIGGMIGSFIPVIGTILGSIIGTALGSLFKSGGGPKTGGSGWAGVNAASQSRLMTDSDQDTKAVQIAQGWMTEYKNIAQQLGVKGPNNFTYGVGFAADPKGSADSLINSQLMLNGSVIRNVSNANGGRTEEELKAALEKETLGALIAAIKASNLPAELRALWDKVTDVSKEKLQELIAFSSAVRSAVDVAGRDAGREALDGFRSSFQMFTDDAAEMRRLTTEFDGTAEAASRLATANEAYYKSLVQLLQGIESARRTIGNNSQGAREQIMLAGRTNQEQYEMMYDQWYGRSMDRLSTLKDPAQIAQEAERSRNYAMTAFGLLSPEEQRNRSSEFLEVMDSIDALANQRLDVAATEAQTLGEEISTAVRTALQEAATRFFDAATVLQAGADTFSESAGTPVQVQVDVDVNLRDGSTSSQVYTPGAGS